MAPTLAVEVASDCPQLAMVHLFLARERRLDYRRQSRLSFDSYLFE